MGSCLSCAGIVKDCRLVSGCMHRFCSECIEKWLRVARCDCTPSIAATACSRKAWNCKGGVYADAAGLLAVERTMQLPMTLYAPGALAFRAMCNLIRAEHEEPAAMSVPHAVSSHANAESEHAGSDGMQCACVQRAVMPAVQTADAEPARLQARQPLRSPHEAAVRGPARL